MKTLDVVVGGQYGSEGKGHVTHRVIRNWERRSSSTILNIRVAGPNAGHTVITDEGVALPLRTIPVGVATSNTLLYIGPGSEVDVDVLMSEIRMVKDAGLSVRDRMVVHPQATLLEPKHIEAETDAQMHQQIGSTGKGIGAARSDRIMRTADLVGTAPLLRDMLAYEGVYVGAVDMESVAHVVIEGTQGYGLGLHAGFYPKCTSSDCRASDFVAMAGVNPWAVPNPTVWVCLRPHPIRVAGNSGPLKDETTWDELGLPAEKTTVTQKVRRVGAWDGELARLAVKANGANVSRGAITMLDQVFPEIAGETSRSQFPEHVMDWLLAKERELGVPISLATTGPNSGVWM